jgi:hypothetical protein
LFPVAVWSLFPSPLLVAVVAVAVVAVVVVVAAMWSLVISVFWSLVVIVFRSLSVRCRCSLVLPVPHIGSSYIASTHNPPHEQLLAGLEAGAVVYVLLVIDVPVPRPCTPHPIPMFIFLVIVPSTLRCAMHPASTRDDGSGCCSWRVHVWVHGHVVVIKPVNSANRSLIKKTVREQKKNLWPK